jgi:hypothetical protein
MSSDKPLPFIYQFAAGMLLFLLTYLPIEAYTTPGAVAGVSEVSLKSTS